VRAPDATEARAYRASKNDCSQEIEPSVTSTRTSEYRSLS
jgi:hypothetical protein